MPADKPIENEDLVFHILNVGKGDSIIVEFPVDKKGKRYYGLVDCYNVDKVRRYFTKLREVRPGKSNFEFICATHPHFDHVSGINTFLKTKKYQPKKIWDSGFRHELLTYQRILETLSKKEEIELIRVSSGMEWYFGNVQITALAPSIYLRNRYATYGVDVNNASIVLRFENHKDDLMLMKSTEYSGTYGIDVVRDEPPSIAILAGDAEMDSWSHIVQEFPHLISASEHKPLVTKMINYLNCSILKVSHHGSMHSAPLDVYEIMSPSLAVISAKQEFSRLVTDEKVLERNLYPHKSCIMALEEVGAKIATTEGLYESELDKDGVLMNANWNHPGSIVVVIPPGGEPRRKKLTDTSKDDDIPDPPIEV